MVLDLKAVVICVGALEYVGWEKNYVGTGKVYII